MGLCSTDTEPYDIAAIRSISLATPSDTPATLSAIRQVTAMLVRIAALCMRPRVPYCSEMQQCSTRRRRTFWLLSTRPSAAAEVSGHMFAITASGFLCPKYFASANGTSRTRRAFRSNTGKLIEAKAKKSPEAIIKVKSTSCPSDRMANARSSETRSAPPPRKSGKRIAIRAIFLSLCEYALAGLKKRLAQVRAHYTANTPVEGAPR